MLFRSHRWAALENIGKGIEEYLQKKLKNPDLRIAIVPLGSTLIGFAGEKSDVDLRIHVLEGTGQEDINLLNSEKVNAKLNKILKEYSFEREIKVGFKIHKSFIVNMTLKEIQKGVLLDEISESSLFTLEQISYLFLPVVYGDKTLVERARLSVLSFLGESFLQDDVWLFIQQRYLNVLTIDYRLLNSKQHYRERVSAQMINPDSIEEIGRASCRERVCQYV